MKRVRGSFRIPLLSRGLHRLSIRILFVNHLLQIMNGGGGHTDYYFIFTATTSSIWISHVELFISICTSIIRANNGDFMTETELTFSNMTPAEPPSYVPVAFRSDNGN